MPVYFSNFLNFVFRRPRLLATLSGHTGPVVSLTVSRSGRLLASGGVDGVKVWDLKTKKEIVIPQQPFHERGQVSGLCWVTRPNEVFETFCYGNALGFFIFLQHCPSENCFKIVFSAHLALGGEVLSMTADISSTVARIATGTRDKCIQVWDFDSGTCKLTAVYSRVHDQRDMVPKAMAFDSNPGRDIFVFSLYDGGLYKCSGSDGLVLSRLQLGDRIGNAAVDIEHKLCVVDNVGNGFDLYKLDTGSFVRTLEVGKPRKTYPKGVVFANGAHAIVAGSDRGMAYIFDRKSGHILKKIKHSKTGGVETIAAHDEDEGTVLIVTASVRDNLGPSPIRVWRWTPAGRWQKPEDSGLSIGVIMEWVIRILVVCAAVAYAFERTSKAHFWNGSVQPETVPNTGLSDEALREYIKEQIIRNSIERYIEDSNSIKNKRTSEVATEYNKPNSAGGMKVVDIGFVNEQSDADSKSLVRREGLSMDILGQGQLD